ncbi:LLM class flavin-dependent oxidoreductase [Nonomuraea guangzhouensis]|uniref:LLM class flavin-dependent oxidoreductase n=1 Tax=Nonomuraea guangzhouensis TaxID=1291555 RepID=A0ABW4G415_9ACTN|nr:LLM class flavin-dependent oxidoreductase [Nonomuraea guangzhouensis]
MATLKVGFLLPTRDWIVLGDREPSALIEQARLAEDLGFDSVWAGDSPVTRPRADPLMLLSALAAVTERVTLGTAVLLPALRHPILLAHQLATLDRISDGRLIAGMGAGFPHPNTEAQCEALGIEFKRRVSRTEESIDVMRQLWAGATVSHRGTHFAFHDVTLEPKPAQAGGPPIWLAGSGAAALRRVGRLADGWLPYPPTSQMYADEWGVVQEMARLRDPASGEAAARSVTPALYATVCLDDEPERARDRMRSSIERYYNVPLEFIESIQATFAGPADDAVDWLNSYALAGVRHVVIRFAVDDYRGALEEFAERVLPRLHVGVGS